MVSFAFWAPSWHTSQAVWVWRVWGFQNRSQSRPDCCPLALALSLGWCTPHDPVSHLEDMKMQSLDTENKNDQSSRNITHVHSSKSRPWYEEMETNFWVHTIVSHPKTQTTSYQGMLTTCWFVLELVSMLVECSTAFNTSSQIDSAWLSTTKEVSCSRPTMFRGEGLTCSLSHTWQLVDIEAELSLLVIGHGLSILIITAGVPTQGTLLGSRPWRRRGEITEMDNHTKQVEFHAHLCHHLVIMYHSFKHTH